MKKKKLLVLDLDETLIHSSINQPKTNNYKKFDMSFATFYVMERPYVKKFLAEVSKWYTLIIMTASVQEYADPIVDRITKYGSINSRYYRRHCKNINGVYIKDLDVILNDFKNHKISDIIILDNSPTSYLMQPTNAIPILSWFGATDDDELMGVKNLLESLKDIQDVRSILGFRLKKDED